MPIVSPELAPYINRTESAVTLTGGWSEILAANSRRVAILFCNTGNIQFTVWPFLMTGTTGTRIVVPGANTPPNFLVFTADDNGGVVRNAWYGRFLGSGVDPPRMVEFVATIDYVDALSRFVAPRNT